VTNPPFDFEEVPFDPASMSTSSLGITKAVWYKRPWVIATIAIFLVVAISVIVDIPHHITKAEDASSQNASMKLINADTKACAFAVTESFNFYNIYVRGKLTPSELTQTTSLLTGDHVACSFGSHPLSDLTDNIQVRDTKAGKYIDRVKTDVRDWMTHYALQAIVDIQSLFQQPGVASTMHDLSLQESNLASQRALAFSDLRAAQKILGITLTTPTLPILPHIVGV